MNKKQTRIIRQLAKGFPVSAVEITVGAIATGEMIGGNANRHKKYLMEPVYKHQVHSNY